MMLKRFFDISTGFRFSKLHFGSVLSIPVAVLGLTEWALSEWALSEWALPKWALSEWTPSFSQFVLSGMDINCSFGI